MYEQVVGTLVLNLNLVHSKAVVLLTHCHHTLSQPQAAQANEPPSEFFTTKYLMQVTSYVVFRD